MQSARTVADSATARQLVDTIMFVTQLLTIAGSPCHACTIDA